jgi:5-methylcytosine-specific restriction endonuclease McrA
MVRCLVLNSDYEPLNICGMNRALKLVYVGKADILHEMDKTLVLGNGNQINLPSVVRLRKQIKKRSFSEYKVSRRGIFTRDNFICQYCGKKDGDLTLDHVHPRHLGGKHTWDNLVTCCNRCNNSKGWKTLDESGMKLLSIPKRPKYSYHSVLSKFFYESDREEWRYYLSF